jgi:hypothetical protein
MRPEELCKQKNSNNTIGNRTRLCPACSAVPQPTALRRTPLHLQYKILLYINLHLVVWLPQLTSLMHGRELSRKVKFLDVVCSPANM